MKKSKHLGLSLVFALFFLTTFISLAHAEPVVRTLICKEVPKSGTWKDAKVALTAELTPKRRNTDITLYGKYADAEDPSNQGVYVVAGFRLIQTSSDQSYTFVEGKTHPHNNYKFVIYRDRFEDQKSLFCNAYFVSVEGSDKLNWLSKLVCLKRQ